jgi:hypothetical protein
MPLFENRNIRKFAFAISAIVGGVVLAAGVVSAATTISTNIQTGGTLSVTGTSTLTGSVGVATSTPWGMLSVTGPDTSATSPAFVVANSNNTPLLSVFDNGNVGIATTSSSYPLEVSGGIAIDGSGTLPNNELWFNDYTSSNYPQYFIGQDHRGSTTGFTTGTALSVANYNPNTSNYTWPLVLAHDQLTDQQTVFINRYPPSATTTVNIQSWTSSNGNGVTIQNNGSGSALAVQNSLYVTHAGNVAIGNTTPVANFQVANGTNATTTVEFGSTGQNKGSCLKLYRTDGSAIYAYVAAGATTFTLTTTACANVSNF